MNYVLLLVVVVVLGVSNPLKLYYSNEMYEVNTNTSNDNCLNFVRKRTCSRSKTKNQS